jgi:hypothetical protein
MTIRKMLFVSEFDQRGNFAQNAIFVAFQPAIISSQ